VSLFAVSIKMKIRYLLTFVVPNLYGCLSSIEHTNKIFFEEYPAYFFIHIFEVKEAQGYYNAKWHKI